MTSKTEALWRFLDWYLLIFISYVVMGCYHLCECRPLIKLNAKLIQTSDEWTFDHLSNHGGLNSSDIILSGLRENADGISDHGSLEIINQTLSDEINRHPDSGQPPISNDISVLSVDDVMKRETGDDEMDEQGDDVGDTEQNKVEKEVPPNHVLPSLRPPTRWSKIKFTLIELAVFIALFMNIFLLNIALTFCRQAHTQAGFFGRQHKKNLKKYSSVNPDSD